MARRVIVELDALGEVRGFVPDGDPVVVTRLDGTTLSCQSGVTVGDLPVRAAPLFGDFAGGADSMSVTLNLAVWDLFRIRKTAPLQALVGRVYWWPEGEPLRPEHELYVGVARNPDWQRSVTEGRASGFVSFDLVPKRRTDNVQFPPAIIGDEGRFPDAPEGSMSRSVPILYGAVRGLPLYAVSNVSADPINLIIAGHPISTSLVTVYRDGAAVTGLSAVQQAVDGLGSPYSYVAVVKAVYDAGDDLYLPDVSGWVGPNGNPIDRLGDVLIHLFRQYGIPADARIDDVDDGVWFQLGRERVEHARSILNRIRVGIAITGAETNGTVMGLIESRLAGELPFVAGFAGGRYGWDATLFPEDIEPVAELTFRHSVHSRTGPVETSADDVLTSFQLGYADDGVAAGQTASLTVDDQNSGECRRALSRWGRSPTSRASAPSCPTEGDAYVLMTSEARKRTAVRDRVFYAGVDARFYGLPLLSAILVTDADLGWVQEPFLLESKQPRADGTCDVALVSARGA